MSEQFSSSSCDQQSDLRCSAPSLSGSQNKSQSLLGSIKLSPISDFVQPQKTIKNTRINKRLSLGSYSDGSNKEISQEILEKFSNESLYREKLKIFLNKNEDLLEFGTSNLNNMQFKSKRRTTLKSIRRAQKQNARKTLLQTVQALQMLNQAQIN